MWRGGFSTADKLVRGTCAFRAVLPRVVGTHADDAHRRAIAIPFLSRWQARSSSRSYLDGKHAMLHSPPGSRCISPQANRK